MSNLPKFVIVIPARSGSTGIINKNLKLVHGESLVHRTFAHALHLSNHQIPICVSTDSLEILNSLCKRFGLDFESLDLKPDSLVKSKEIFIHFRSKRKAAAETLISENLFDIYNLLADFEVIVDGMILLQPTTPFRNRVELDSIREIVLNSATTKISAVSATQVDDMHPARMYYPVKKNRIRQVKGFRKSYYLRRQDLPPIFIRDGGYYLIGADLLKSNRQYSRKPLVKVRDYPWSINIDSEIDLLQAQAVPQELVLDDPSNEK
jgi:CMP-N,N'-diacetyllegionaminic acid synthase